MDVQKLKKCLSATLTAGILFTGFLIMLCISIDRRSNIKITWTNSSQNPFCLSHADLAADFLHMSIKTGNARHDSRMIILLKTWIPVALQINAQAGLKVIDKVRIITDTLLPASAMESLASSLNVQVRTTPCKQGHDGSGLHCKTSHEFEEYYRSAVPQSWYCHFDDDMFVNIPNLIRTLQKFNHSTPYFLGKTIRLTVYDQLLYMPDVVNLSFASGCSFCISRALMERFKPVMLRADHKLFYRRAAKKYNRGDNIGDDVLLSLIATEYLNVSVTHVDGFYDHTHGKIATGPRLDELDERQIKRAMTLAYHLPSGLKVIVPGVRNVNYSDDPTRFLHLHDYYLKLGSQTMCGYK